MKRISSWILFLALSLGSLTMGAFAVNQSNEGMYQGMPWFSHLSTTTSSASSTFYWGGNGYVKSTGYVKCQRINLVPQPIQTKNFSCDKRYRQVTNTMNLPGYKIVGVNQRYYVGDVPVTFLGY